MKAGPTRRASFQFALDMTQPSPGLHFFDFRLGAVLGLLLNTPDLGDPAAPHKGRQPLTS